MQNENIYYYKLVIEYCGTEFSGWQKQSNALSIQEVIENSIYKFTNEYIRLFSAGRTDSGVHATHQVAHFSISKYFCPNTIIKAINHHVYHNKISIISCDQTDKDFHARFSAIARHYVYRIIIRRTKPIFEENRAWWVKVPLDIENMKIAANFLIGKHDFTSFRGKHCQAKNPVKNLSKIEIIRIGEEIKIYVSAPSFLHHMVRNIVGTLYLFGINKLPPFYINTILNAKDRSRGGQTAPACGLYLIGVDY